MKRFHVHLNVTDLSSSVRFYSALFGAEPMLLKPDYAKWVLDDPRVNFAVSSTGRAAGIDHLGIQAETEEELAALGHRLDAAGGEVLPEHATVCCYAKSDKAWTEDPQGTRWETFRTFGDAHSKDAACSSNARACASAETPGVKAAEKQTTACCGPAASSCC